MVKTDVTQKTFFLKDSFDLVLLQLWFPVAFHVKGRLPYQVQFHSLKSLEYSYSETFCVHKIPRDSQASSPDVCFSRSGVAPRELVAFLKHHCQVKSSLKLLVFESR